MHKLKLLLLFPLLCSKTLAITLYVAPHGNDSASGSRFNPLASMEGARIKIRELPKASESNITVEFASGEYYLDAPVSFDWQDSGKTGQAVTYRAARRAKPLFTMGKKLPPFEVGSDGIWYTYVQPGLHFEQLYINGKRAVRARSPNKFYYYMQSPAPHGIDPLTGNLANMSHRAFIACPSDIAPLANMNPQELSNVMVRVYHSWEVSHARIESVDIKTGRVVVTGSSPWRFFNWDTWLPRYHIENFKAALDTPGEWLLESDGKLLYIPLPDEKPHRCTAVAPVGSHFIMLMGDDLATHKVQNIHFEGLAFAYTSYNLPPQGQGDAQAAVHQRAAIELHNAENIAFKKCTISHIGAHGIWFKKDCHKCMVEECHLFDLGGGAVRVGTAEWTPEQWPEQLTSHITLNNNILHNGGRFFHGATGVWIGHASDISVTHNDIADFFYTGISVGWIWGYRDTVTHRINLSNNHIHHLGWGVLSDMGGIYTLGNSPGSIVSSNHIHDINSYDYTGRGGWGLYTDEGSTRFTFENNLVYNTKTGNIHQHYGRENIFRNNILVCSSNGQIQRSRIEDHTTLIITNNIIYWDNPSPAFWRGYHSPGSTTTDLHFDNNIYWNPNGISDNAFQGLSWKEWQATGQDQNSTITDPGFRNPAKHDFTLSKNSLGLKKGIPSFDPRKAGVYGSRSWRNLAATPKYPPVEFAPPPQRYQILKINDNFDAIPVGALPHYLKVHLENKGDSISVSDEEALSGKHSLKIQDAPGLQHRYNPHLTITTCLTNTIVTNSFAIRLPTDADLFFEWRDYPAKGGNDYAIGPSLIFNNGTLHTRSRVEDENGNLSVKISQVAKLPPHTWIKITITAKVSDAEQGSWSLRLEADNMPNIKRENLLYQSPEFKALEWLGLCSMAEHKTTFFIDDLTLDSSPQP